MIRKSPEKKSWRDCEEKFKTFHHSLITVSCYSLWSVSSDSISSVPLAPPAAVSWPEILLIVVLTACSQTGHYSPQPSTDWVCVGGRVWTCGEVYTTELERLQDITTALLPLWRRDTLTHLVNTRTEQRLLLLHTSVSHHDATNAKAAGALTVTLWFWESALAYGGKGSAAMKRPPHSALLTSTTSFVSVASKRWNKESRHTDANNRRTWLWRLECKQLWANVCCWRCTCP